MRRRDSPLKHPETTYDCDHLPIFSMFNLNTSERGMGLPWITLGLILPDAGVPCEWAEHETLPKLDR